LPRHTAREIYSRWLHDRGDNYLDARPHRHGRAKGRLSSALRFKAARIAGGRRAAAGGSDLGEDLASNAQKKAPAGAARDSSADVLALTLAANQIAANNPGTNGYELRNELLQSRRVRYGSDGKTDGEYSVQRLREDALRKARHSRTLGRNIDKASGVTRPADVCAHHIVASQDLDARLARGWIFGCKLAINDVDNGVYLPRFRNVAVPSLPNATVHPIIHTARYHLAVYARFLGLPKGEPEPTRLALRDMRDEMVAGVFPF